MIWRKHQILKPPSDEEMAAMEPADLMELHYVYHEAIENAEKDPSHCLSQLPNEGEAENIGTEIIDTSDEF